MLMNYYDQKKQNMDEKENAMAASNTYMQYSF